MTDEKQTNDESQENTAEAPVNEQANETIVDKAEAALNSVGIDPRAFMEAKFDEQDEASEALREKVNAAITPMLGEARDGGVGLTILAFFDTHNRSAVQQLSNQAVDSKVLGNMLNLMHTNLADSKEKREKSQGLGAFLKDLLGDDGPLAGGLGASLKDAAPIDGDAGPTPEADPNADKGAETPKPIDADA